jgi:formylglycine-generating enzyme required for sulfatase activity
MRYLTLIILIIYSLSVQAQPRYALVIGNSNYPGKSAYLTNPVNDAKDMKALLTSELGFSVIDGYDVNQRQFKRLIQKFNQRLRESDSPAVALIYFSGHGFAGKDQNDNDTNYLVPLWPKNMPPTDQISLEDISISSNSLVKGMRRYNKKGVNMIVLDACRNSPKGFVENYQEEAKGNLGGFVNMDSRGIFIAYATALGHISYGASDIRNSIYTGKLLEVLKDKAFRHKNITEVFNETAFRVAKFTDHYQEPWFSASGVKFCFENCSSLPQLSPPKSDISSDISQLLRTCQQHFNAYRLTTGRGGTALDCYSDVLKKDRNNAEALRGLDKIEATYVAWIERALSRGQKKRAERYMAGLRLVNPESPKLRDFEDQMQTPPVHTPHRQSFSAGEVYRDRLKDGSKGPQMVWIAAGSFEMGSNNGSSREKPVHRVSITQPFAMGRYEVTVGEFRQFVNATGYRTDAEKKGSCYSWSSGGKYINGVNWRSPGFSQNDNHPVVCVSWNDAMAYAKWLSQQTGKQYSLPSEAQWEYAARAGTKTARYWGNDADDACGYANVADKKAKQKYSGWTIHNCTDGYVYTAPVGQFEPNAFGLFDMLGNVWEWCADPWHSNYKGAPTDGQVWSGGDESYRVLRGGSWNYIPGFARTAGRRRITSVGRAGGYGFRVVSSVAWAL